MLEKFCGRQCHPSAISITEKVTELQIRDFMLCHRAVKKQGAKHSYILNSIKGSCVSYGKGKGTQKFDMV